MNYGDEIFGIAGTKNVTVISRAETFTVMGMIKKLKEYGVPAGFSTPELEMLEFLADETELFILLTDEPVEDFRRTIVFLKDTCIDTEKRLMLVGTKRELDYVMQYFPEKYLVNWFDRPMVLPDILEAVRRYIADEQVEARKKSILIVDDDSTYMLTIRDWLLPKYRVAMVMARQEQGGSDPAGL